MWKKNVGVSTILAQALTLNDSFVNWAYTVLWWFVCGEFLKYPAHLYSERTIRSCMSS